jgi:predicted DsbA family dithiol-disulfide isomerase
VDVCWRAFPLHPETPDEGLTLAALFAGRGKDIPGMLARLQQVAAQERLPWGKREKTFNSRRAQELGKWAESKGAGDGFHAAVFRAYFVDGRNIAHTDVLVDLALSLALPGPEAERALADRSFRGAVDADWERARAQGISAVPTFVMDARAVVGAQSYEVLADLMRVNHVRARLGV